MGEPAQLPLNYEPQPRNKRVRAIWIVQFDPENYKNDFANWLNHNWKIYEAFERRALRLIRIGCKNMGSMAIINNIRWQSALAERGGEFKINNNRAPDLSRLFEKLNPEHAGFFRHRERSVV